MQMFKTLTRKIVVLIVLLTLVFSMTVYASNNNPSRQEVEAMIEEVAQRRAIPAVLLKAIARVESSYKHFNDNGTTKISSAGNIGLMMVGNKGGGYDNNKLMYDVKYNIEAGADVLLSKWSMSSFKNVASVGNMDPNILENWYFALWAYNGWAQSNNPHMLGYYGKTQTFQQRIYNACKEEYNQYINNIDFSHIPTTGNPSRGLTVPTPTYVNYGGIVLYEKGDLVKSDSIRNIVHLRDQPSGKYVYDLGIGQIGKITEGPILKDGYYWYKMYINDNWQGWIERNWLERVGDEVSGMYNVFEDISYHWARKSIMKLYSNDKITGFVKFRPDDNTTRETFCTFLSKTIDLKDINANKKDTSMIQQEVKLPFTDVDKISTWANEHVKNVYVAGMIDESIKGFRPTEYITRKEAALILSHLFEDDDKYETLDINSIFKDITTLSKEEKYAIKKVYMNGLISGKGPTGFHPNESLTRAEAATIMVKIMDKANQGVSK